MIEHVLDPVDDERRVERNLLGGRARRGQHCVGIVEHVVDETDLLGARCVDVLAGQSQLTQVSVADDRGQTREAAHVCDDRDLDLADAELGIGTCVADVRRRDQVDAAADAPALHSCDDGLAAICDGIDARLHALDHVVELGARACLSLVREDGTEFTAHRRQVQSEREVLAGTGDDDCTHLGVGVEVGEDFGEFTPEIRPHRVALARPDQRHLGDVVFALDGERIPALLFSHYSRVTKGRAQPKTAAFIRRFLPRQVPVRRG